MVILKRTDAQVLRRSLVPIPGIYKIELNPIRIELQAERTRGMSVTMRAATSLSSSDGQGGRRPHSELASGFEGRGASNRERW